MGGGWGYQQPRRVAEDGLRRPTEKEDVVGRDVARAGDDCRVQSSSTTTRRPGRHWGYQWTPVVAHKAKHPPLTNENHSCEGAFHKRWDTNCRKIDDDVDNYNNEDENLASRHNKSRIESYTRTTTTMTTSKRMFI